MPPEIAQRQERSPAAQRRGHRVWRHGALVGTGSARRALFSRPGTYTTLDGKNGFYAAGRYENRGDLASGGARLERRAGEEIA